MTDGGERGWPEETKDAPCAVALRVFLGERGGNHPSGNDRCGGWLSSTKELRVVSLELCNTCRSTLPLRVWVGQETPRSLWGSKLHGVQHDADACQHRVLVADGSSSSSSKRSTPVSCSSTRPRRRKPVGIRAITVVWDRQARDIPAARSFLRDAEHLKFGFHFNEPLATRTSDPKRWPEKLVTLDLGVRFQYDVSGVIFPPGLLELRFGAAFNRCIRRVAWPTSLRRLTFGASFNKPIVGVQFPAALRHLEFGASFDQPLSINCTDTTDAAAAATRSVSWPPILESLTFGAGFSQEIGGSSNGTQSAATLAEADDRGHRRGDRRCGNRWPITLKRLTLSEGFHQPLDKVAWPQALEELNLDCVLVSSDQGQERSAAVVLPTGLKTLRLDFNFHQPIQDVMPRLPGTLVELVLGDHFNQPVFGLRWPPSLQKLSFGASFNQPIADENARLPPQLEELSFGSRFNQPIAAVRFPPSLRSLSFRDHFNQPVADVRWPESLRELRFGRTFDQNFSDDEGRANWPTRLSKLTLGKHFRQPVQGLDFPPGLLELEFGQGCEQELEGMTWPAGLRRIIVDRGWGGRGEEGLVGRGVPGLPENCRILRR
ncbi:unnamed protein product [Scytosiphon promiscuus]